MVQLTKPLNMWPIFYKDGRLGCQVYSSFFPKSDGARNVYVIYVGV